MHRKSRESWIKKSNSTILTVGIFTLLLASSMYVVQDAEAAKSKGNSLTDTNSKKVCGDRLCSDVKEEKSAEPQMDKDKHGDDAQQTLEIPYDLNKLDPYFETRNEQEKRNIENVVLFYSSFNPENFDAALELLTEEYIQHNPQVPTGKAGFIEAFSGMPDDQENNFSMEIKRVYIDGDYVFTHSQSSINNELHFAVIDIFRLNQDGLIAEHWDVVQQVPETSMNDNTMFYLE